MAEKLAKHPAGSIPSSSVSDDGALVMCPVSFVERISDVMQFVQTCAAPKHIKTLAEEIGSYSNALLEKTRADEEWSRYHARQTARETRTASQALKESPDEMLNAKKTIAVRDDAVVEALKENTAAVKENTALRENDVRNGTHRAMSRFWEADEIELEKIRRLRDDGWEWKDVVMEVYPNTKAEALDRKVNAVQKQLNRDNKSKKGNI